MKEINCVQCSDYIQKYCAEMLKEGKRIVMLPCQRETTEVVKEVKREEIGRLFRTNIRH